MTIALAVLSIYAVDFAINIGKSCVGWFLVNWTANNRNSPGMLPQFDR